MIFSLIKNDGPIVKVKLNEGFINCYQPNATFFFTKVPLFVKIYVHLNVFDKNFDKNNEQMVYWLKIAGG